MTARPAPNTSESEPAARFLSALDRRLGPTAPALSTWPATVLYWKSAMTKLVRSIHGTTAPAIEQQGVAE